MQVVTKAVEVGKRPLAGATFGMAWRPTSGSTLREPDGT